MGGRLGSLLLAGEPPPPDPAHARLRISEGNSLAFLDLTCRLSAVDRKDAIVTIDEKRKSERGGRQSIESAAAWRGGAERRSPRGERHSGERDGTDEKLWRS